MSIAIAREAARLVFKEAQLSLPVDLEELAQWRGLVIEPAAGWRDALCARLLAGERRILVNANHPSVRRRFSVAHEIGHFILGHDQIEVDHGVEQIFGDEAESFDVKVDVEQEANAFAVELLMPRAWVKDQASKVSANELVPAICGACDVSKPAAWYRIMELKVGAFSPAPRRKR